MAKSIEHRRMNFHMDRALAKVFWGLLWGVLLAIGVIEIPLLRRFGFPAHLLPLLYSFWGLMRLHRIKAGTSRWETVSRVALGACLITIYFVPLLEWWRVRLDSTYLALNAFAAAIGIIVFLTSVNLLSAEAAQFAGDGVQRRELAVSAWVTAGMLILITGFFTLFALLSFFGQQGMPFREFAFLAPPWHLRAIAFLPVALTLVSILKCRFALWVVR